MVGGEGKCETSPQGEAWHWVDAPLQEGKQVPVESGGMRREGHRQVGACSRKDLSGHRNNVTQIEGHSPLKTAEEEARRDTGR